MNIKQFFRAAFHVNLGHYAGQRLVNEEAERLKGKHIVGVKILAALRSRYMVVEVESEDMRSVHDFSKEFLASDIPNVEIKEAEPLLHGA